MQAYSLSPAPLPIFNKGTSSSLFIEKLVNLDGTIVATQKKEAEAKKNAEIKAAKDAEAAKAASVAAQQAADAAKAEKARIDAIAAEKARIRALWTAGNDYAFGNCTWYVANRREVPPTMGDARSWLYSAQRIGMETGPTPQVGAVAWYYPGNTLGHVAYVEEVYSNGTILISEMNYIGFNMVSTRVVSPENWYFIY